MNFFPHRYKESEQLLNKIGYLENEILADLRLLKL